MDVKFCNVSEEKPKKIPRGQWMKRGKKTGTAAALHSLNYYGSHDTLYATCEQHTAPVMRTATEVIRSTPRVIIHVHSLHTIGVVKSITARSLHVVMSEGNMHILILLCNPEEGFPKRSTSIITWSHSE